MSTTEIIQKLWGICHVLRDDGITYLGEEGRFRRFTREEIAKRGDNLDMGWLKDDSATSSDDLGDPDAIAAEVLEKLRVAITEMEALRVELARAEA